MKEEKSLLEKKKLWTQIELQNAAKKIFWKKGYANTTIEEIAKTAGVSKGSIYLYFKNKDDLYISLMIPVLIKINESLRKLQEVVSNREVCRDHKDFVMCFFEHYKRIYKYDSDGIRIIQAFQLGDLLSQISDKNREALNKYARDNFEIARNIISEAIDSKLIPKVDPIVVSDWFYGTFIGIVQLEESKLRGTKKDHVLTTLESAFLLISNALRIDKKNLRDRIRHN